MKLIFKILIVVAMLFFIAPAMADSLTVEDNTIAKGDYLAIGAQMYPSQSIQIWIFGKNYWNGASSGEAYQVTAAEGKFSYAKPTSDMPSGTYYIVTQSPGPDGLFNITTKSENERVIVTSQDGSSDFIIWGTGNLQGADAAEALTNCISSPSVDDTYARSTFVIEEPWIRIDPIGDHYVGDHFQITGTTNIGSVNTLSVIMYTNDCNIDYRTKATSDGTFIAWPYEGDTSYWISGPYTVTVSSNIHSTSALSSFNLISNQTTDVPTATQTLTPTPTATAVITQTPTPTATSVVTQTATATPTSVPTAEITQVPTAVVQASSSNDEKYEELNAEIAALKEKIDEKDSEIEKQNSVIDALINLIKALFGM